jgi:hypothetical protein
MKYFCATDTKEEFLLHIKDECGPHHADATLSFINTMLADYSDTLGISELDLLRALETRRDYYAPNFYQAANFPSLRGVRIFADLAELKATIPSRRYRCPACAGVSTDPYTCNSGVVRDGKTCDWKAYGLFHTFGKGFRFTIREGFIDKPVVDEIFMPLELEKV